VQTLHHGAARDLLGGPTVGSDRLQLLQRALHDSFAVRALVRRRAFGAMADNLRAA
jgi:hypothetical protein